MSNDVPPLPAVQSHFTSESYDEVVRILCEPPPATGNPEDARDALAVYVGRSNARVAALVLLASLLEERYRKEAARMFSKYVSEIRSRPLPEALHIDEAENELRRMAVWLRGEKPPRA